MVGTADITPPNEVPFIAGPSPLPLPKPVPPNIDTRSSKGFVEVPASRLAAAGVAGSVVAARPEG